MRLCKICGLEKNDEDFGKTKSGRRHQCKACLCLKKKESYRADQARILGQQAEYRKKNADSLKQAKQRYRERNRVKLRSRGREHYAENQSAYNERAAEYRTRMKDAIRIQKLGYRSRPEVKAAEKARKRKWAMDNPEMLKLRLMRRRAIKKAATIYPVHAADLRKKAEMSNGLCQYCKSERHECWDHDIPLARGGSHSIENLTPACNQCNLRKGTKTGEEFRTVLSESSRPHSASGR